MDPVHIFPINRDKENAVISRLFSMFSINLVQAKSSNGLQGATSGIKKQVV